MKAIRVLHVLNSLNRGGAETMIMNYFREIDRHKIQFDFVVHQQPAGVYADEVKKLGGRIFYVPRFHGWNLVSCLLAWWQILKIQPQIDIVHGQMPSTACLYLLIAKFFGRYTIAHAHSTELNNEDSYLQHKLRRILYFFTRQVAQKFYGCSQMAGLTNYGEKIVNSDKFAVWHNAIDYDRFYFSKEWRNKLRSKLRFSADTIVLGHVGRLTWAKNHAFLLKVFAAFKQQQPNAKLLLVGDGELRQEIEQQARELKISDDVHFVGDVDDPERYMSVMDVFVFPSHYEGLPTVNIEAQVNGLPCVVSPAVPDEVNVSGTEKMTWVDLKDIDGWVNAITKAVKDKRQAGKVANNNYDIKQAVIWAQHEYETMIAKMEKR